MPTQAEITKATQFVKLCEDPQARRRYRDLPLIERTNFLALLRSSRDEIVRCLVIAKSDVRSGVTTADIDRFCQRVLDLRTVIESDITKACLQTPKITL